ncbi:thiamine-phosphate kinase [Barrientosiimonas marina]|uniref:Thiamine-monophosphate kinase n=1 Tax=Lentibacillus kimchii TaxID=1542911 RepID=A0ABW2UTY5_9BACI
MDEFSLIDLIKQKTYRQSSIIRGIGDDAAVFRQPAQDIVTAVDTFVEDIHFTRSTMRPFHIGYRSLAANISDLSAMGARPAFYLVSIVVPSTWSESDLSALYNGMAEVGSAYQMDVIGGDTTAGSELTVSVTVFGYASREKVRYRHTAKPGDAVFVTGHLGDSAAGLHMLTHPGDYRDQTYFIHRHRMPAVRANFSCELEGLRRVTLNDISDGIASEANEIAEASGVTMTLYDEAIPVSAGFEQFSEAQQQWKLYGGEDFELLGTLPQDDWGALQEAAYKTGTPVTMIGYVESSGRQASSVFLENQEQSRTRLNKQGYTHLK